MRWEVLELGSLFRFLYMHVAFTSLFAFLRKQAGIISDSCSKEALYGSAVWESYPLAYIFFLPGVKSSKETAQRQIYLCEKWSWDLTCWFPFALSNCLSGCLAAYKVTRDKQWWTWCLATCFRSELVAKFPSVVVHVLYYQRICFESSHLFIFPNKNKIKYLFSLIVADKNASTWKTIFHFIIVRVKGTCKVHYFCLSVNGTRALGSL